MSSKPLVSLTLVVKNGMPYIKDATRSVKQQTYKKFEVIVQDGNSTDGTLQYLQSLKSILNMKIKSAQDSRPEQGWNRAIKRCRGEIIGSIDADNLLKRDALENVVKIFKKNPRAGALYGISLLINEQGKKIKNQPKITNKTFNLIRLMRCDLVPPFATAFFQTKVAGKNLRIEESLKTCGDFDLWLRLSHLPIIATNQLLSYTRVHPKSSTKKSQNYDQFCKDKLQAIDNYFSKFKQNHSLKLLKDYLAGGVYTWAAESIYNIEGKSKNFKKFLKLATALDPYNERAHQLTEYARQNLPL